MVGFMHNFYHMEIFLIMACFACQKEPHMNAGNMTKSHSIAI